jgi:hypothetical protein
MIDRLVLIALDGLRNDLVTPELTPTLWALRQRGQWFNRARSVFPSYTRVCTASVMTGAPPASHGLVGNVFHHPATPEAAPIDCSKPADLQRLLALDGGIIFGDTLDQALAAAGKRMDVVTGTKPGTAVVLMADPAAGGHWLFNPHGRDTSAMPAAWDEVTARFGPPPPIAIPLLDHIAYLGEVFADHVLAVRDPDVALLWLAEPDTSLHYRGTYHADTHAALRAADAAVGRALAAIEAAGRADRTAVLVFSDHGQISCPEQVDLLEAWASLGLAREAGTTPGASAVLVRGRCGGITLLPAGDGAPRGDRLRELAEGLMARPELGMLFSRGGAAAVPGTLPHALLGIDHPRAPDLLYVLGDAEGIDPAGLPGLGLPTAGDIPVGGGMHGGLHPRELGNVLLLGVPGQAATMRDAPAGLLDIATTVLGLLGIDPPAGMVGRNLASPDPAVATSRHDAGNGAFTQWVELATVGRATYALAGGRG